LQDKTFYQFKTKIESAGSLLSQLQIPQISHLMPMEIGNFNLEYSEYIKTEFDYIKHWDLSKEKSISSTKWNRNSVWKFR
jgi:hypothetical protein